MPRPDNPGSPQKISEKEFTAQVLDAAKIFRWRTAHFRPAMTSEGWRTPVQGDGQGFPDLILCRDDKGIAAELKVPKTKTVQEAWANTPTRHWEYRVDAWNKTDCEPHLFQPGQIEWLRRFWDSGWRAFVWCPADLDEIIRTLK